MSKLNFSMIGKKNILFTFFFIQFFIAFEFSAQTYTMTSGTVSACSGTFYDSGGNSADYSRDEFIVMTICSGSSLPIYLQFTSFDIENNWDYLYIYNGVDTNAAQISCSPFTGTTIPNTIVSNNPSNCLTFVFSSDSYVQNEGWAATISCGTPPPPPPTPCSNADPFCSTSSYTFPAATGTTAHSGPNYGCLSTRPNPAWYFMQIGTSGTISIDMSSNPPRDIDFALWGPFTDLTYACDNLCAPLDCSYSSATTENALIPNAIAGEYYVVVITNFSNQPTNISFALDPAASTGTTDCDILCNITNLNATPGACQSSTNTFNVTGTISTTAPPTSGTLSISCNCNADTLVFNPPFASNLTFNLTGLQAINGSYTLTAVYSAEPTCKQTVVIVSPPPCNSCNLTASNNGPLCKDDTIHLTSTTISNANYTWKGPGAYLSNGQNVSIINATPAMSGTYSLTAIFTLPSGQIDTCYSTTNVIIHPLPLVNAGIDDTICVGQTAPINATGATTYSWNSDPTLSSLSIPNPIASPTTSLTTYTVTGFKPITGSNRVCSASDKITIYIAPDFAVSTANTSSLVCYGDCNASIITTVNPATGPFANYTFLWNTNASTANINGLCAGNYSVTVKDIAGCSKSSQISITAPSEVVLTETLNTPVLCYGGSNGSVAVSASGGSPGYTYSWLPIGAVGPSNNSLTAGTYTVVALDQAGCSDSISVFVNQPNALLLDTLPDTTICIGQQINLNMLINAGTSPYQISWNNGVSFFTGNNISVSPTTTTTYSINVVDANGCNYQNPAAQLINVQPPLQISTIFSSVMCEGDKKNVSVLGNGGNGNYTFTWLPSANVSPLNSDSSNVYLNPSTTTHYTVIVKDDCGSPTAQTNFVLTVYPIPVLSINPSKLEGCEPLNLTFVGTSSNSVSSCLWNFGDNTVSNVCGNVPKTFINDGLYQVSYTVNDANGCTNTTYKNIKVHPVPVAIFTTNPNPANILEPEITFYNVTDAHIGSQTWYFWDSIFDSSILPRPTHTFSNPGEYDVTLVVVTDKGCVDTTVQKVVVEENISLYIPNSFTPDDDGNNDQFTAYGIGIEDFKLIVFDRWGQKINETNDMKKGWDGNLYGGKKAEVGIYIYRVEVVDIRKIKKLFFGTIALLR